jgi:hypothetical protein
MLPTPLRPLICASSPTRLPLPGPGPSFTGCSLTPRVSSLPGHPHISSSSLPSLAPARLQPHDRKGSATRRHRRPRHRPGLPSPSPHASHASGGRRAPRSPPRALPSAAAAAAERARGFPDVRRSRKPRPRRRPAPPPSALRPALLCCAPLSPPSPALPPFRALRLRVSASHCSESVTAPARAQGCSSPLAARSSRPPLPLLSASPLLLPPAVSPPALSVSESRP